MICNVWTLQTNFTQKKFRSYRGGAVARLKLPVHFSIFYIFRCKFLGPPIYAHTFFAISEKIMIHRTSLNQKMHVPMQGVPENLLESCVFTIFYVLLSNGIQPRPHVHIVKMQFFVSFPSKLVDTTRKLVCLQGRAEIIQFQKSKKCILQKNLYQVRKRNGPEFLEFWSGGQNFLQSSLNQ